jgi:thiol:disulfide interchange protein DsbD
MKASKHFFFEKKKQKTFAPVGHGQHPQHGLNLQSFFCFFFVHKKEVLLFFFLPFMAFASPRDTVRLISQAPTAPNGHVELALDFTLQPGWHIYWLNAGDAGFPPSVTLDAPAVAGPLSFPPPEFFLQDQVAGYVLSGHVVLPFAATGVGSVVSANANWLVCANICVPEHAQFTVSLAAAAAPALFSPSRIVPSPFPVLIAPDGTLEVQGLTPAQVAAARFFPNLPGQIINRAPQPMSFTPDGMVLSLSPAGAFNANQNLDGVLELTDRTGAMQALSVSAAPGIVAIFIITLSILDACLYAFVGGLLLNLMPCVFPILAMKALSLVRLGGGHAREVRSEAFFYTAGILAAMAGLGGTLLLLRSLGAEIGWGFQLQSPIFVMVIAWVILLATLNLAGLFKIGVAWGGGAGPQHAFLTGLLAVAVATPCTAPFMGAAVAAALAAPPAAALGVFLSLGLGLALPFLLIGLYPPLAHLLPRPGAWMLWLQRALAIPMGLTFGWLAWVLIRQAGPTGALLLLASAAALTAAVTITRLRPVALLALLALPFLHTQAAPAALLLPGAEPYTAARLATLQAENQPAFIDLTAAWCITCLVNEHSTLDTPEIRAAFATRHITLLVGDWTNRDPAITALLQANGRDGVPLYLFYPAEQATPVTLPQVLTPSIVEEAIK